MSYDIRLKDPKTGETVELPRKHGFGGGTFELGGSTSAWLNITYNYSWHYRMVLDKEHGVRWLYGKTLAEARERLEAAIKELGTERYKDYWAPTPGNAGGALQDLLNLAALCPPDSVFDGD